jgi:PKD repeat protein
MFPRLLIAALAVALISCGGSPPSGPPPPEPPPPPPPPPVNSAPSATILSPQDGAVLTGSGPFQLVGTGSDAEDGTLSGSALKWSSNLDGTLTTGSPVLAPLSLGEHRLTLDVTDSGGKQARAQITVTVRLPNRPPTASISSPASGASISQGTSIVLNGAATDPEEGALTGTSLSWSSDRAGALGTGAQVTFSGAAVGAHVVTLTARDSAGLSASATVQFTVVPVQGNQPPVASISAPAEGAMIEEGTPIILSGTAQDPEQGTLSGASLSWSSDRAGALGTGSPLTFTGAARGTHVLLLTAVDSQGLAGYASRTITVVPVATNQPPTVTLSQPANGAQLIAGQPLTLMGQGTDQEDGTLPDSALTWTSSRDGALGTGRQVSGVLLSAGSHTLTLTGRDSMNATASASVLVTVTAPDQTAPVVTITSPANGYTLFEGTPLTLEGSATDAQEGPLPGSALRWSSSLAGALGTGSPLTVSLTRGTHQVTLAARDTAGNEGIAQISVVVLVPNAPPTASITSPSTGARFTAGTVVALRGTGTDPEDGPLSGASLTWLSSRDGTLGTGQALDIGSLTEGTHQITLSARDSGGRVGSASIQLIIEPAPVNLPPVARLTGPAQGEARQALSFDGSTSSDPDGTIVSYRFDFGDGTPPVTGVATQVQHTYATEGNYTVTLQVTDNGALTSTATLPVTVTPYVRRPKVLAEGPEQYGSECALVMRGSVAHVAFRNTTHPSLWYGTWDGTTWQMSLVDGMGYGTGGVVGTSLALALAADGTPHLAYRLTGLGAWYATRSGTQWIRERVDAAATVPLSNSLMSLALDPSQGFRPTLAYSWRGFVAAENGTFDRTVIAYRTGAAAWTSAQVKFPSTENDQLLRGDILFDSGGTLYVPNASSGLGAWKSISAPQSLTLPSGMGSSSRRSSLAWGSSGPLVLASNGLHRVTLATPYSASTVNLSTVENFTLTEFAVAAAPGGSPRIAVSHGGSLETMQPGPQGAWERTGNLDTVDAAQIDVAVDDQGQTRVCFFRAGKLVLY